MTVESQLAGIPPLGAGMGYRDPYRGEIFLDPAAVDFLEIIADHYMGITGWRRDELALLRDHYTLIPHGLNLSLGSAEGLDREYARSLCALVDAIAPPYWSEHLAVTRAGGIEIGHLTPLPFSGEAIDAVCRNVATVQEWTPIPLILENITYTFEMPGSEMTEAQFLCEVTERTGCGLLLDVTNLYTNAVNHGYDLAQFLDTAPLERVVQLHFTGGVWDDGFLVDSHSEATPPEVWDLLEEVLRRAPVRGVILERDENLPPFHEVAAEVARARQLGLTAGRWPGAPGLSWG